MAFCHSITRNMEDQDTMKAFLGLLGSHERYLTGYTYSLIPNSTDAEDILQDVKIALWENFDQFEIGTNFAGWSKQVAFYRIMAFRKKKAIENKRLFFSETCMELLHQDADDNTDAVEEEVARLNLCIDKLPDPQRELVSLRYKEDFSIEEISVRCSKSIEACYKSLSRIRLQLKKCLSH